MKKVENTLGGTTTLTKLAAPMCLISIQVERERGYGRTKSRKRRTQGNNVELSAESIELNHLSFSLSLSQLVLSPRHPLPSPRPTCTCFRCATPTGSGQYCSSQVIELCACVYVFVLFACLFLLLVASKLSECAKLSLCLSLFFV